MFAVIVQYANIPIYNTCDLVNDDLYSLDYVGNFILLLRILNRNLKIIRNLCDESALFVFQTVCFHIRLRYNLVFLITKPHGDVQVSKFLRGLRTLQKAAGLVVDTLYNDIFHRFHQTSGVAT